MRLLLVDDNAALTWRLQDHLNKQFEVQIARSGSEGHRMAQTGRFDAIILDLGLPDIGGEEVCLALRKDHIATPILILTAEDAVGSKVRLLEGGADDYLTKPFEISELLARIKALLRRRYTQAPSSVIHVGELTIDPHRRTVERAGQPITLRRKEFDILEYLARHRGTIVTQAMILDYIWDDLDKSTWNNTIRVHIKHLRDKIDRPFGTELIKTARGVGYLLDSK